MVHSKLYRSQNIDVVHTGYPEVTSALVVCVFFILKVYVFMVYL